MLEQYLGEEKVEEQSNIMVEKGTGVRLKVGVSPSQTTTSVPRLLGRRLYDAKGKLWEQGLNVAEVSYDEGVTLLNMSDARVCRQSVLQGTTVDLGTKVALHLTLDKQAVESAVAEAEQMIAQLLKEQELADSLARVTADSLRLVNVKPQPEQADDEFFY